MQDNKVEVLFLEKLDILRIMILNDLIKFKDKDSQFYY